MDRLSEPFTKRRSRYPRMIRVAFTIDARAAGGAGSASSTRRIKGGNDLGLVPRQRRLETVGEVNCRWGVPAIPRKAEASRGTP